MWETIYSGEAVEIDIVKGEDFEQVWTFDEDGVVIPFVTNGWSAKAAISDRTGNMWNEDMAVTLADDGSVRVFLGRDKTLLDKIKVGTHIWTLVLIEPVTGYHNVIFNPPARVHAGAVK